MVKFKKSLFRNFEKIELARASLTRFLYAVNPHRARDIQKIDFTTEMPQTVFFLSVYPTSKNSEKILVMTSNPLVSHRFVIYENLQGTPNVCGRVRLRVRAREMSATMFNLTSDHHGSLDDYSLIYRLSPIRTVQQTGTNDEPGLLRKLGLGPSVCLWDEQYNGHTQMTSQTYHGS